jgi:hypothetical protein
MNVEEYSSLMGCVDCFTLADVSEALALYIFSVKEVQNSCHMRQGSTICQLPER